MAAWRAADRLTRGCRRLRSQQRLRRRRVVVVFLTKNRSGDVNRWWRLDTNLRCGLDRSRRAARLLKHWPVWRVQCSTIIRRRVTLINQVFVGSAASHIVVSSLSRCAKIQLY